MSNQQKKIWVKWKNHENGDLVFDRVRGLKDDDEVIDLRDAFANERNKYLRSDKNLKMVDPSYVEIRATEESEKLDLEKKLAEYFTDSAASPAGPGTSRDTALYVTWPNGKRHRTGSDLQDERPLKRLKNIGDGMVKLSYQSSLEICKEVNDSLRFTKVKAVKFPAWNRYLNSGTSDSASCVEFLEREAHVNLREKLMKIVTPGKKLVVTGMPGVGKSWFVDYFAWHCLNNGDTVILENDLTSLKQKVNFQVIAPGDEKNTTSVSSWCLAESSEEWNDIVAKVRTISKNAISRGKKCWYLVDYRRVKTPVLQYHSFLSTVNFASPSSHRWENFFESDSEKGQEPIEMFPHLNGEEIQDHASFYHWKKLLGSLNQKQTAGLVTLFGPSLRYCLSQFFKPGQGQSAIQAPGASNCPFSSLEGDFSEAPTMEQGLVEVLPPGEIDQERKFRAIAMEKEGEWDRMVAWSSRAMLEDVLEILPESMKVSVKEAAMTIRGKLLSSGAVSALENIRSSPTNSRNDDRISTRLLVWGKTEGIPYANYASPFICCLVVEEKSKEVLDFIANFFESSDYNIGTGSGWMYECFILKYWLPSLEKEQSFSLNFVGDLSKNKDRQLVVPEGYRSEVFAELSNVDFSPNTMYLPTKRNLGAVDCFCLIGDTLWLLQVTTAAEHPISEPELSKVLDLAASKHGNKIKKKYFVFVVPSWRVTKYAKKAQIFQKGGKTLGLLKVGDTDETIHVYKQIAQEFNFKNAPGKKDALKKFLKEKLSEKLREEPHNYQNDDLESWSVSKLSLHLKSVKKRVHNDILQLIWPVNKADYDMFIDNKTAK